MAFVFGGSHLTGVMGISVKDSDIHAIDMTSGTVTTPAMLPMPITPSAAVYHPKTDKIYVLGEISESGESRADIHVFDPDPSSYSVTKAPSSLPSQYSGFDAVYSHTSDSIYLFGGMRNAQIQRRFMSCGSIFLIRRESRCRSIPSRYKRYQQDSMGRSQRILDRV